MLRSTYAEQTLGPPRDRIACMLRSTGRIDLNELELPGNNAVVPGLVNSSVLDGVLQKKECPNLLSSLESEPLGRG